MKRACDDFGLVAAGLAQRHDPLQRLVRRRRSRRVALTAACAVWQAGPTRVRPGPCSSQIRSASRLSHAYVERSATK